MPPSFTATTPACSYVCVRGSGWDKTASPVCLDLSNVSTLAASHYTPIHPMFRTSLTPSNLSLSKKTEPEKSQKSKDLQGHKGQKRAREGVSDETQKVARKETPSTRPKTVTNRQPLPPRDQATPQTISNAAQRQTQPQRTLAVHVAANTPSLPSPSTSLRTSRPTLRPARPQVSSLANTSSRPTPPNVCMQTLLQEKRQLQRLNEALTQRLHSYQTVFTSRNTLQKVMVNLGISVC